MGERTRGARDRRPPAALPPRRVTRGAGPLNARRQRQAEPLEGAVDSHAHLQHEAFAADREAVIDRAVAAGIERILVPGYNLRSSIAAIGLATLFPGLIDAAVGVHPHHAGEATESEWEELEQLASSPDVVAIGEIGLDFYRNLSSPGAQRDAMTRQLELARRRALPVLVHDRDAHGEITEVLLGWDHACGSAPRGVLHCFSGDRRMATLLTDAGYLVSFALPVTFSSARAQRDAAAWLRPGTFLLETDSPWLAPGQGQRNEPTTVLRVAHDLARLRDVPAAEIVNQSREAYLRLVAPSSPRSP